MTSCGASATYRLSNKENQQTTDMTVSVHITGTAPQHEVSKHIADKIWGYANSKSLGTPETHSLTIVRYEIIPREVFNLPGMKEHWESKSMIFVEIDGRTMHHQKQHHQQHRQQPRHKPTHYSKKDDAREVDDHDVTEDEDDVEEGGYEPEQNGLRRTRFAEPMVQKDPYTGDERPAYRSDTRQHQQRGYYDQQDVHQSHYKATSHGENRGYGSKGRGGGGRGGRGRGGGGRESRSKPPHQKKFTHNRGERGDYNSGERGDYNSGERGDYNSGGRIGYSGGRIGYSGGRNGY